MRLFTFIVKYGPAAHWGWQSILNKNTDSLAQSLSESLKDTVEVKNTLLIKKKKKHFFQVIHLAANAKLLETEKLF